jgi:5-methylthioadenosine/S-adenosylhomocysteine deaminase
MKDTVTLLHPRWIITMDSADRVLQEHSLVMEGDRIQSLLPTADARQQYPSAQQVALPGHALLPGLVNTHTHVAMNLLRGLADDLPLMTWLNDHIWPVESALVSPEFVRSGTELAMAEMLRSGITCFNDMYFFPDETAQAASQAGMRAVVGMIVIDFPSAWASNSDEYFNRGIQVHDRFRSDPLITMAFAPHAPYSVNDEALKRVRIMSEELDVPIHMHVHETRDEIQHSLDNYGRRPLARLHDIGLLNNRLLAVHMTQLDENEIRLIADNGCHVIHCPESNLKLASGFCQLQQLLDNDINVALGTDGAASNNDLSLLGEMRTAALLAKGIANDARAGAAHDILAMATINGARALGLEEEIGSLEPGKAADIIAVDMSTLESEPVYDPISHLVYVADRQQVSHVWVAGKHLVKERELTSLDSKTLLSEVRQWQEKVWSHNQHG